MSMSAMSDMHTSGSPSAPSHGAYLGETPHGSVFMRQQGDHLTGSITVLDLPPGSHHAVVLRGPDGRCASPTEAASETIKLPDLVADEHGTARLKIDRTVNRQVVRYGFDVTVLRDPTLAEVDEIGSATTPHSSTPTIATEPSVLCGNV